MQLQQKAVSRRLKEYKELSDLMKSAFPENERVPVWLLNIMSRMKNIKFTAYYDDGDFCGTTYAIETDRMIFLLYFTVSENYRSKGYGTRILSQLKNNAPQKEIILDVEIPDTTADNYDQRVRRIAFYERNGFSLCDFRVSIAGTEYNVLSTNREPDRAEFESIIAKCHMGKVKNSGRNHGERNNQSHCGPAIKKGNRGISGIKGTAENQ